MTLQVLDTGLHTCHKTQIFHNHGPSIQISMMHLDYYAESLPMERLQKINAPEGASLHLMVGKTGFEPATS